MAKLPLLVAQGTPGPPRAGFGPEGTSRPPVNRGELSAPGHDTEPFHVAEHNLAVPVVAQSEPAAVVANPFPRGTLRGLVRAE
jgi:hypothetical protein